MCILLFSWDYSNQLLDIIEQCPPRFLCKYNYIKKVGYHKIMQPLLNDVKTLEQEGIILQSDGRSFQVFGSIVIFTGDNLMT